MLCVVIIFQWLNILNSHVLWFSPKYLLRLFKIDLDYSFIKYIAHNIMYFGKCSLFCSNIGCYARYSYILI